jgi:hypothetical protein
MVDLQYNPKPCGVISGESFISRGGLITAETVAWEWQRNEHHDIRKGALKCIVRYGSHTPAEQNVMH